MSAPNGKPSPQLTLYPKSDFLVRLRETKGLSQSEVEIAAGLPKSRLYHYEKGRPIPFQHLQLIAKAYAVPARDLIDDVSLRSVILLTKSFVGEFGITVEEMNGAN